MSAIRTVNQVLLRARERGETAMTLEAAYSELRGIYGYVPDAILRQHQHDEEAFVAELRRTHHVLEKQADGTYHFKTTLNLIAQELDVIPIRISHIEGSANLTYNYLTDLSCFQHAYIEGGLDVSSNNLVSLKGIQDQIATVINRFDLSGNVDLCDGLLGLALISAEITYSTFDGPKFKNKSVEQVLQRIRTMRAGSLSRVNVSDLLELQHFMIDLGLNAEV